MNLIVTFVISLMFSLLVILLSRKEKNKKFVYIMAIIMFFGCFIRLYKIDTFPIGLNQDEASIGYEAYGVANYGIDRNGRSYPVHFISWGSGQNALYAYLIVPIINILGNDSLSIRLPMALFGCITLLMIFIFVKKYCNNNKGVIILLFLAIMPWHIMKSRWGLESNIFPDIIIYGLIFIYFGISNNKKILYIISSILFGISVYAYGTSYLYVPILLLLIYGYLVAKKKIKFKEAIIYFLITGFIALPMILFVVINYFNLNSIKIFNMTIPRLYYNRFTEITSVNGNVFINCLVNFVNTLKLIIIQQDGLLLNYLDKFGIFYIISLPFLVYGIYIYFKKYKENVCLNILFMALIAGFVVSLMVDVNINRLNVLWIPIYSFIILGVIDIIEKNKLYKYFILGLYLINFIFFVNDYFGDYQERIGFINNNGLRDSILHIDNNKDVYVTGSINQPYIFWLYYKKISPYYYIDNRVIQEEKVMFQQVTKIDNIFFYLPNELEDNTQYIMRNYENRYDVSNCIVNNYKNFILLDC